MTKIDSESIWADDLLGRKTDADFLIQFLENRLRERLATGRVRSYVLNIDAPWGSGKTYFFHRFQTQVIHAGHMAAYVNAWADDHADDPLIAVMAAIDLALRPHLRSKTKALDIWRKAKRSAGSIALIGLKGATTYWAKRIIGDGADEIRELLARGEDEAIDGAADRVTNEIDQLIDRRAEEMVAKFSNNKKSIEAFRKNVASVVEKIGGDEKLLFVLVDELDRCRPPYAISLLERVKHLFELNGIVFLVATDTQQLQHSIKAVYGNDFSSERYLYRFFDRTYRFEEPSLTQFIDFQISRHAIGGEKISLPGAQDLSQFLAGVFGFFDLTLRDIEQCFDILRSVISVWNNPVQIQMIALLPLIIGFQQGLGADFSSEFNEALFQRSRKPLRVWKIPFPAADHRRERYMEDGRTMFAKFARAGARTLDELVGRSSSPENPSDTWIRSIFGNELHVLHRNVVSGRPFSIIGDYPKLVRSAGRLLPQVISR